VVERSAAVSPAIRILVHRVMPATKACAPAIGKRA